MLDRKEKRILKSYSLYYFNQFSSKALNHMVMSAEKFTLYELGCLQYVLNKRTNRRHGIFIKPQYEGSRKIKKLIMKRSVKNDKY